MSEFTYDPGTERGQVRMLIADTRAEHGTFSDDEIDAAITTQGSVEGAVYQLAAFQYAQSIRTTSARSKSGREQSMSVDDSHTPEHWRAMMEMYRPFALAAKRLPTVTATTSLIPSDRDWHLK